MIKVFVDKTTQFKELSNVVFYFLFYIEFISVLSMPQILLINYDLDHHQSCISDVMYLVVYVLIMNYRNHQITIDPEFPLFVLY